MPMDCGRRFKKKKRKRKRNELCRLADGHNEKSSSQKLHCNIQKHYVLYTQCSPYYTEGQCICP